MYYDDTVTSLHSQAGKTIAITGTTSGTGFAAARAVAKKGANLILLNRVSERAKTALKKLKLEFPNGQIFGVDCDLTSFASVRKAARKVKEISPEGLDVLCNNAGVLGLKDEATVDGFDIQMQTNHLSHFLLTKELVPELEKVAQKRGDARIVNHSSIARYCPNKLLLAKYLEKRGGDLGGNGKGMTLFLGGRWLRYQQSKLANCAFTSCLHNSFMKGQSQIKAVVAHPGLAKSKIFFNSAKSGMRVNSVMNFVLNMISQSPEDGAVGIIKGMCDPSVKSGDFIGPGAGRMAANGPVITFALEDFYNNAETRDLLWHKSCEAIGEDFQIDGVKKAA